MDEARREVPQVEEEWSSSWFTDVWQGVKDKGKEINA